MPKQTRNIIGWVGANLDNPKEARRWEKWRPTISLFQHEHFAINRMELLHQPQHLKLAELIASDIRDVSAKTQVRLVSLDFEDPWDFVQVYDVLHDFARAHKFDDEKEEYFVHLTTGTHVAQICMFLLAESGILPAKLIQTSPPKNSDKKSPGSFEIIDLDLAKYDRIVSRFQFHIAQQRGVSFLKQGIETQNVKFNQLIELIEQVAITSRDPLLLMGRTGVGKSQLAKLIYDLKVDREQVKGKFVSVNCATLRGDSAMSALFGHTKGAFTSALEKRSGLLMEADEGVLFLDEIGELGLGEQAMLLHAIEQKSFLPIGSDKEVASDFQLIAGTNSDLGGKVGEGLFREDLLARIDHWTFTLPELRDRVEDIEPNLQYELEQYARRNKKHVTFTADARTHFLRFAVSGEAKWSRNFRDLNRAINRMATLARTGRITIEVVDGEISRLKAAWRADKSGERNEYLEQLLGGDRLKQLDAFKRMQLEAVIKVCRESRNLPDAGRTLYAASRHRRKTMNDSDRLRKYLKNFGIEWHQIQNLK